MPPPRLRPLPRSGEVITVDFRHPESARQPLQQERPIRIVQWNIERGYQLEGVIEELKRIDADILSLQEIDIGCARSNWEDTGERIASELKMNYAFVCEFEEFYSSARSDRAQGGGVHGNAILSKFDMSAIEAVDHRYQPVDWEDPSMPIAQMEPRRGRRLSLMANVHTPQGPMVVFSAHLEVFTGIMGRLEQFSELLHCSKDRIEQGFGCQALLGDLNTLGHGIARWSPGHCNDALRWRTLGLSEGKFWLENVFAVHDPRYGAEEPPRRHHPVLLDRRQQSSASAPCLQGFRGHSKPKQQQHPQQEEDKQDGAEEEGAWQEGRGQGNSRGGGIGRLVPEEEMSCMSFSGCAGTKRHKVASSLASGARDPESVSSTAAMDELDVVYVNGDYGSFVNRKLLELGLSVQVCKDLLNPGFDDPFDISTPTIEPEFMKIWGYPLMNGKLDWLLLRNAEVEHKEIGNHDYALSDHKWLLADIHLIGDPSRNQRQNM